jgi:hypothetical protein
MKLIFFLITMILSSIIFAQGALRQLEEMTGQKVIINKSGENEYYNPSPPPGPEYYNGQYKEFTLKLSNDENQAGIKNFEKGRFKTAIKHFKNAANYLANDKDKSSIQKNIQLAEAELKKERLIKEINKLDAAIKRDLDALNRIRISKTTEDFEFWASVADEQKTELSSFVISFYLDRVSSAIDDYFKAKKADAKGFSTINKYIVKLGHKAPAGLSEKINALQKNIKDLKILGQTFNLMLLVSKAEEYRRDKNWAELSKLILIETLQNPTTKLIMNSIDNFVVLTLAGKAYIVSRSTVETLMDKTEKDLKMINQLSERLQKNVTERKKLKAEL